MAINGKNQIYFSKKDLSSQKTIATGFKKIKFYHQASEDDTQIDLLSLTLPSSGIPASATNPGASDLSSAKLLFNRNNILLMSSLSGLLDFDSYSIISNTVIELATPAADGEIFIGIIDHVARTGLRTVDADPIVVTGTLTAGDTEFIVGKPFDLNKYPTTQQGALLVFLDGQLMARNVGNALADPGADGDYQEVGVGSIGSSIEFNNSDPSDRSVMIVNSGLMATAPNESILAQIENIAGQVDNMIPTLAALAGVDETTFQTAPNSVDLINFGNRMLAAESSISGLDTYVPVVASSVNAISANYSILDNDGYDTVLVTTGASDKTVTLPSAANNNGRKITVKKVDSGIGYLIITGSDTIDGVATGYIPSQYDYLSVVSDGSSWSVIDSFFQPLQITNQESGPSIANATVVDMGSDTLTIPPGKYSVMYSGNMLSYFNPAPTFVSVAVRLTDLADAIISDDDSNLLTAGEGASMGETGGGGNSWAVLVNSTDNVVTVASTITVKMRCYYRNSGGTEIGGLGRQGRDGKTVWKKIGL